MASYSEKLRDVRWQKKRLEIMQRDNWVCQECKATNITLNVHHKQYIYGCAPWEYENDLLVTICEECHKKEHGIKEEVKEEDVIIIEYKYEHLIDRPKISDIILAINNQIDSLTLKLKDKIDHSLMEEIFKNIMFLRNKKNELEAQ